MLTPNLTLASVAARLACPERMRRVRGEVFQAFQYLTAVLIASSFSVPIFAQQPPLRRSSALRMGVEIVSRASVPELHVDGIPFFVHGAQFDYFRIPPDLWAQSLNRYRELGINTIDLRIPWNWHEPSDAQFDFDGHTNPRRNLRGLLRLITEKQMKIVVRPGPLIGDHWRNAGYPAWLLGYSTYKMNEETIEAGQPPPDAELASRDGNAAARDWLANETHMSYARRWLTAVARELASYSARNTFEVTEPGDREGSTHIKAIGGPLLYVVLDDATQIRPGSDATDLSRYVGELRKALEKGGLEAISFISEPDVVTHGVQALPKGTSVGGEGITTHWFFNTSTELKLKNNVERTRVEIQSSSPRARFLLSPSDAEYLSLLAKSLAAQPDVPPLLSGFATTTFAPADDVRAAQPSPDNLLLASRILLGTGLRGITYSPLQDTLTPAGWGVPSTARYFRWDAALDLAGNRGPLATGVARNGNFISMWGAMLASSHLRAESNIVNARDSAGSHSFGPDVIVTQLVANETAATKARLPDCVKGQLCAAGLVSIANISADRPSNESFEIADPVPSASGASPAKLSFDVMVPARESLFLPVHAPLCSDSADANCTDEVISAGAELLDAERDGKTLELKFYAPGRASVRLHLESQPGKVELDENIRPEISWQAENHELIVSLLRGAAPDYLRVLRIHLRYTPHVSEKPDPDKGHHGTVDHETFNGIRLPLAPDVSISTGPPLIPTGPGAGGQLVVSSWNHGENQRQIDFTLEGSFHGSDSTRVFPGEQVFTRIRFQATHSATDTDTLTAAPSDGLLRGQLTIRAGREAGTVPILFFPPSESGNAHYQNDFDRDGSPEWVLESSRLRLIVSPADGGRVLTLVDKSTNENLITLGGALRDLLNSVPAVSPVTSSSADFSSNQPYRAAWLEEQNGTGIHLAYSAHEHSIAGLQVEKILRLTAPETVEAAYRISLGELGTAAPPANRESAQTFISQLSVPASDSEDGHTRFCRQPPSSNAVNSAAASAGKPVGLSCQDFVPSGPSIEIPAEITLLEIQTPNHHALVVEWTSARVTIVPRNFSAQLEFAIAAPSPGGAPAEFTLRYTVGEVVP